MMLADKGFKSYQSLKKLKNQGKYDKPDRIPRYLDSKTGRQIVHYEKVTFQQ